MAYHPWVKGLKPVAIELMFQDMTEVWVDDSSPRAKQK
jgi:peptide/nickel transport system substrate-binding protein